jgi:hypothetical protein
MAVVLRQSRRFDAPSPVIRYWIANCVGFSIAGGGHGTVERILADGSPHDPSAPGLDRGISGGRAHEPEER